MRQEYAGFWIRLGATLIDGLLISIVLFVPLTFIYGAEYWVDGKAVSGFWDFILKDVMPFFATLWFWNRFSATPGKMATKLRIVDANTGGALTTKQSVIRYFSYLISFLPLGLGFIWIGFDNRKQAWHDKIAGTVVIKSLESEPVRFNGR